MKTRAKRSLLGVLCMVLVALGGAVPAQGAAPEPDFVLIPRFMEPPPPESPFELPPDLQGPCGAAVDSSGHFYLSNYYNRSVDVYRPLLPLPKFVTLRKGTDPLDGPCGLGVDSSGDLYVNNYHRNVEKFTPSSFPPKIKSVTPPLAPATSYASAGVIDSSDPTGVAVDPATDSVYVNARSHITAYDDAGTPLMDGPDPLRIGEGSLQDGYGLAISAYPPTAGRLYAPDHADDTVKVYDPALDVEDPVQTIAGPPGGFGSLRDSAVAVDSSTGEVYVADALAYPQFSERPEAVVYVFNPDGTYKGRLKYNIVDGSPPGLAVDNFSAFRGRVYVTSGNTELASVYAYPKGSATNQSAPAAFSLSVRPEGNGSVAANAGGIECSGTCTEQVRSGATLTLTATPGKGAAFTGWSGAGCSGTGECEVAMTQARSVSAEFTDLSGPPVPAAADSGGSYPRPAATTSTITQKGTLRVDVSGRMAPKRLPRDGAAPISVSVGGEISTTDQSLPPQLKRMRIELNKEGRLDSKGLPACVYDRIQPGSSSRALSACRPSLVGEGSFTANITLAGQEPYPTKGKLLVFMGTEKGKPVLYGHIYAPKPFATSFVIVFKIQRLGKGTYGTALDAPLPAAMDAWGRLTGLQMTLSRRYSYKGESRSFISAGCPAPKGFSGATFPLAKTEFSFDGGKKLSSVLSSQCKAR